MGFVTRKLADPAEPISAERRIVPAAPGAVSSPQVPGQVPDRSSVPGEGVLPVSVPETTPDRPMTEYGTAQRIMRVFEASDLDQTDPARFEQAPISYEEMRKAYPALRTPMRPTRGYVLADGTHAGGPQTQAIQETVPVEELPSAD